MSEESLPEGFKTLHEIEREHILKVVAACTSKVAAARALGICIRTLRNKLRKFKGEV